LVTSACATAEIPEESTSHYTDKAADIPQGHVTDACSGSSDPCCSAVRVVGSSQVGKAAWYNQVGKQTATGEILDASTATAAHRSLPLASCAKVTNLDNGRSVVVKINDRGPFTRGRILDLSPRAADALDMKGAGVAAVVVEPLVSQTTPTVTVF
jgi:rare lipoprotein A